MPNFCRLARPVPAAGGGCVPEAWKFTLSLPHHCQSPHQIEKVPVPLPLLVVPLVVPEPELLLVEKDEPLDLLPDPLIEEPLVEPLVDPDPEPEVLPEPDSLAEVAEAWFTSPLEACPAGRSLCVHTPSAE